MAIFDRVRLGGALLMLAGVAFGAAKQGGTSSETLCVGPEKATRRLVYLHGFDSPKPSAQERGNRDLLRKLAGKLGVRIAIPRGSLACRHLGEQKVCWPMKTPEDVQTTYRKLRQDVASCFGGEQSFVLLGFSNGGYYAGKLVTQCVTPTVPKLVAVGSAGSIEDSPASLATCGELHLLIGKEDITNAKAKTFARALKAKGVTVELEEFPGGHVLDEAALEKTLGKVFGGITSR